MLDPFSHASLSIRLSGGASGSGAQAFQPEVAVLTHAGPSFRRVERTSGSFGAFSPSTSTVVSLPSPVLVATSPVPLSRVVSSSLRLFSAMEAIVVARSFCPRRSLRKARRCSS